MISQSQAPPPVLRVHASTHPGRVRERNEDALGCSGWAAQGTVELASHSYSGEAAVVCVVADGLGGQSAGDVASFAVTEQLVHGAAPTDTGELTDALLEAHDLLLQSAAADPALRGMATTVAVLAISAEAILCANVGDTRIYDVSNLPVLPVSFDDNPSDTGPPGERPATTVLTQALGGTRPSRPSPHAQWFAREPDLAFLLCSDGVTAVISDSEIGEQISKYERGARVTCALVELALERGAPDNVSAMLVRIP